MISDLHFVELQCRSRINEIALQAEHASDFPQRIRASLPLPLIP